MRYELTDFEWTAIKPMLPNRRAAFGRGQDPAPISAEILAIQISKISEISAVAALLARRHSPKTFSADKVRATSIRHLKTHRPAGRPALSAAGQPGGIGGIRGYVSAADPPF